jgi:hypothetical protein
VADLSVKLVDHTPQNNNSDKLRQLIQTHLQDLFDEVFNGTVNRAPVTWGTGAASDALVLHFVEDMDHSYLKQKMTGVVFRRRNTGGHTHPNVGGITGSEFYQYPYVDGKRTHFKAISYAQLAFHEALHNQFPAWSEDEMHGDKGGKGLASETPTPPLTERNKELMRQGLPIKNAQLL